jgi:hypothetical protein
VSAGSLATVTTMTDPTAPPERTPAAILEEHGRESIERIDKIDDWVKKVTYGLLGTMAIVLGVVVAMGLAFTYLIGEIDSSRFETAVKGCQINREASHDSISALMESLSKTESDKIKAKQLADTYFKYDRDGCEEYARAIGLDP